MYYAYRYEWNRTLNLTEKEREPEFIIINVLHVFKREKNKDDLNKKKTN